MVQGHTRGGGEGKGKVPGRGRCADWNVPSHTQREGRLELPPELSFSKSTKLPYYTLEYKYIQI